MSEQDPFDAYGEDPDEILKDLDSLKGLLDEGNDVDGADEPDAGGFTAVAEEDAPRPDTDPGPASEEDLDALFAEQAETAGGPTEEPPAAPEAGVEEQDLDALLAQQAEPAGGATEAPPAGPEAGVDEWDLDAFLDEEDEEAPEMAGVAAADGGGSETELAPENEAQEPPAGPPGSAGETDTTEVPVLDDVVFRGDDVPGEAVGLMSALSALPEEDPAEPAATTEAESPSEGAAAPPPEQAALPDPEQLEAMADAIVARRLEVLREQLKREVLEELREQLSGGD